MLTDIQIFEEDIVLRRKPVPDHEIVKKTLVVSRRKRFPHTFHAMKIKIKNTLNSACADGRPLTIQLEEIVEGRFRDEGGGKNHDSGLEVISVGIIGLEKLFTSGLVQ